MWSHYADAFSGFCLQFSAERFYKSIKSLNPSTSIAHSVMNYVDNTIQQSIIDSALVLPDEYFKAIQCKHSQWIYEGELRFVSKKHGLHSYDPASLENLYIGQKMPEGQRNVLFAIINHYFSHVNVFEIRRSTSTYAVQKIPLNITNN